MSGRTPLRLHRETLLRLRQDLLGGVQGGTNYNSCAGTCDCGDPLSVYCDTDTTKVLTQSCLTNCGGRNRYTQS